MYVKYALWIFSQYKSEISAFAGRDIEPTTVFYTR